MLFPLNYACVFTISFSWGCVCWRSRYCLLSSLMSCRRACPRLRSASLSSSSAFSFCSSNACLSILSNHTQTHCDSCFWVATCDNPCLLSDYREKHFQSPGFVIFTSSAHIWHLTVSVSLSWSQKPPDNQKDQWTHAALSQVTVSTAVVNRWCCSPRLQ